LAIKRWEGVRCRRKMERAREGKAREWAREREEAAGGALKRAVSGRAPAENVCVRPAGKERPIKEACLVWNNVASNAEVLWPEPESGEGVTFMVRHRSCSKSCLDKRT